MTILVTGGAGYIGSHTLLYLKNKEEDFVVLDSLRTGHIEALQGATFYQGDLADSELLDKVFTTHKIKAVIHFAADSVVGDSVKDPLRYYENNVIGSYNLVKKMIEHDVKKIVFSSTAATYGEPREVPIKEDFPTNPTNPYGETKLAIEKLLKWADHAYGLKSVCLRYFNAAGADPNGNIGEDHNPESHLIPIVLKVALGQRDSVHIFGDDYLTEDGSCIRDYIHVLDLAQAHYLAIKYLERGENSEIFNLGNGKGFSVKQVIEMCREVTQVNIKAIVAQRRPGDPAVLIASSDKAQEKLGWRPCYNDLKTIVSHAWNWHKNHPYGYNDK